MCGYQRQRGARLALLLSGLVSCAVHGRVAASEGPPPTLNPKSYASASEKYSLFVDPSDLYGRGKAFYKLTRDGREVWSAEKPYTLWDARVGDDGLVIGYAYSHGWRGFSNAGHSAGMGDFRVVIIDPRGKERLDQVTKRDESRFEHTPPNPLASGLIIDAANDRMVVRVLDADVNRQAESWWVYQLSTGKTLTTFRPKELKDRQEPVRYVMDAKPGIGTPLTPMHWPKPAEIPLLSLRAVGRIVLKGPLTEPEPEVRNVGDFVFDDRGRIAFLRRSGSKSVALLVVDQMGKVLHAFPLDWPRAENSSGWSDLTCVGPDRYLLIRGDGRDLDKMGGALVDVGTGKVTPIPGFTTAFLSEVAGFPDGGFVVKGGIGAMTSDNSLSVFDSRGRKLWSLRETAILRTPLLCSAQTT